MRHRLPSILLVVLPTLLLTPGIAVAQTDLSPNAPQSTQGVNYYVSGYWGINFGGTLFETTTGFGAALTFLGRHVVSGEVDFNYSPQFFGPEDRWSRNNVWTLTVNGIIGPWIEHGASQRVRPYLVLGGGLIRSTISVSLEDGPKNNIAVDVGGGLVWLVTPGVGIRGDLRHVWNLGDLRQRGGYIETLRYLRGTLGVAVAF